MKYVNYGCGYRAPIEWTNYDNILPVQFPLLCKLARIKSVYPKHVRYGDIVKGLPINRGDCDGIYCSHVLEHLSLDDCFTALYNTYKYLKLGGVFRLVVPDLYQHTLNYMQNKEANAAQEFMHNIRCGYFNHITLWSWLRQYFTQDKHFQMYDYRALGYMLKSVGFKNIRIARFKDSKDRMFDLVDEPCRFEDAICIECEK